MSAGRKLEPMEGKHVPEVTFRVLRNHKMVPVSSSELFTGKTVIVFSLPGAFTPTCSSSHVPRFNELASTFKANGIDDIICMSVNDPFVMAEWQSEQRADNLTFIGDGNAEFTAAMGMLVDKGKLGMRSWRYSMLVLHGIVQKQFIEPDVPGDPFQVSDADTMLAHINPKAKAPDSVTMFSRAGCKFCIQARAILDELGIVFEEIELDNNVTVRTLRAVCGRTTTPQIFVNGSHVGGCDELKSFYSI
eukprot:NODE_3191_length_1028_cov_24.739530_g2933_i0.p1 GENE.NODE_3191_length_1028_cov_24.739530_g2933_i0~~NODE_3191_length_1028_cov_24.739530_g2933_i0.p1  ORF type:complete len:285 (-),score=58.51 NODE_3191_length_1028_cov_24.739530_g2933_i0:174-914(-)